MEQEHKDKKINPNKAGMYFSLFICVLALAIGTFSAINRKNQLYESNAVTTESVVEIRKNQTDVQKQTTETDLTTSSETTTNKTTQKTTANAVANHFIIPIGGNIEKEFDTEKMQYSQTYGDWRLHLGVDFSAKTGTDVFSSGKGKVKNVYDDETKGKTVVIDHGNSIVCYYCGLKSICVKKGDVLEIGTKIGVVGEIPSEIAEKPHLHFETEKNGKKVDPLKELELKK